MNENKRYVYDFNGVTYDVMDSYFDPYGNSVTEFDIQHKDYFCIGSTVSQKDAESICERLNEQNDELIEYCNFSLHDVLDKKNKEIEKLKSINMEYEEGLAMYEEENKKLIEKLEKGKNSSFGNTSLKPKPIKKI